MEGADKSVLRVYALGDSLALPRPWDGITYEHTYPYLLNRKLTDVGFGNRSSELIVNGSRSRTMPDAQAFWEEIEFFQPGLVVIQIGIVDCAPRIFSKRQKWVLDRLVPRYIREKIVGFAGKRRRSLISILPPKVYTPLAVFRKAAEGIAKRSTHIRARLAFVAIAPATERIAQRSPGIVLNIQRYNAALREVCSANSASFIDVHSALSSPSPSDYLLPDGHHLGPEGHRIVAERIYGWIASQTLRGVIAEAVGGAPTTLEKLTKP